MVLESENSPPVDGFKKSALTLTPPVETAPGFGPLGADTPPGAATGPPSGRAPRARGLATCGVRVHAAIASARSVNTILHRRMTCLRDGNHHQSYCSEMRRYKSSTTQ